VALTESNLSKEQEDLLATHAKQVALILNNDNAGRRATEEILFRFARRVFVRVIDFPCPFQNLAPHFH
jgi:hypothetical protein